MGFRLACQLMRCCFLLLFRWCSGLARIILASSTAVFFILQLFGFFIHCLSSLIPKQAMSLAGCMLCEAFLFMQFKQCRSRCCFLIKRKISIPLSRSLLAGV